MSLSILAVRGIGPAAAAILAESGIKTVADLAAKTPFQVAAIKGFNEIRAAQVVADAQTLIATAGAEDAVEIKAKKKSKAEKKSKPEKASPEKKKKSKKTDANKGKDKKKVQKAKNSDKPEKKDKKNKKKKGKK